MHFFRAGLIIGGRCADLAVMSDLGSRVSSGFRRQVSGSVLELARRGSMKTWIKPFVFAWAMWVACAAVHAQDTGATTSGNWNNASIWTAGTVPGSSNNVYIGSTYPSGAASTATVALTANESAANVYLGNGSGTSGTLNLGGNTLTIGSDLVIGQSGGTGV